MGVDCRGLPGLLCRQLERHDPRRGISDTNIRHLIAFVEEINHAVHAALAFQRGVREIESEEFVRNLDGVEWYNDSKATNVDATLKAIAAFPGHLWVILGGKDKGSDYTALREPLKDKACGVLLIGAAAAKIEAQLKGSAPMLSCETLERAIAEARSKAELGDVVLLAPACASFDQFDNFEHRGREFKRMVAQL